MRYLHPRFCCHFFIVLAVLAEYLGTCFCARLAYRAYSNATVEFQMQINAERVILA